MTDTLDELLDILDLEEIDWLRRAGRFLVCPPIRFTANSCGPAIPLSSGR